LPQPSLPEVLSRFEVARQLRLVKEGGLLERIRFGNRRRLTFEVGEAFAEREVERKFNQANQIPAAPSSCAAAGNPAGGCAV
jgi:hypothetical protein